MDRVLNIKFLNSIKDMPTDILDQFCQIAKHLNMLDTDMLNELDNNKLEMLKWIIIENMKNYAPEQWRRGTQLYEFVSSNMSKDFADKIIT